MEKFTASRLVSFMTDWFCDDDLAPFSCTSFIRERKQGDRARTNEQHEADPIQKFTVVVNGQKFEVTVKEAK